MNMKDPYPLVVEADAHYMQLYSEWAALVGIHPKGPKGPTGITTPKAVLEYVIHRAVQCRELRARIDHLKAEAGHDPVITEIEAVIHSIRQCVNTH